MAWWETIKAWECCLYAASLFYGVIVSDEYKTLIVVLSDTHYTCLTQFGTMLTWWLAFHAET